MVFTTTLMHTDPAARAAEDNSPARKADDKSMLYVMGGMLATMLTGSAAALWTDLNTKCVQLKPGPSGKFAPGQAHQTCTTTLPGGKKIS